MEQPSVSVCLGGPNRTAHMGCLINSRCVFLMVLEAGGPRPPAGSVSGEGCLLVHRHGLSQCLCVGVGARRSRGLLYKGSKNTVGALPRPPQRPYLLTAPCWGSGSQHMNLGDSNTQSMTFYPRSQIQVLLTRKVHSLHPSSPEVLIPCTIR